MRIIIDGRLLELHRLGLEDLHSKLAHDTSENIVAILGPRGIGKTVLMQQTAM